MKTKRIYLLLNHNRVTVKAFSNLKLILGYVNSLHSRGLHEDLKYSAVYSIIRKSGVFGFDLGGSDAQIVESSLIMSELVEDVRSVDQQNLEDVRSVDQQNLEDVRLVDQEVAEDVRLVDQEVAEDVRLVDQGVAEDVRLVDQEVAEDVRLVDQEVAEDVRLVNQEVAEGVRLVDQEVAEDVRLVDQEVAEDVRLVDQEVQAVRICSGCGQLSSSALMAGYLACCPDSDYRDLAYYSAHEDLEVRSMLWSSDDAFRAWQFADLGHGALFSKLGIRAFCSVSRKMWVVYDGGDLFGYSKSREGARKKVEARAAEKLIQSGQVG